MKDQKPAKVVPLKGEPAVRQHKRMAAGDKTVGTKAPGAAKSPSCKW